MAGRWSVYLPLLLVLGVFGLSILASGGTFMLSTREYRAFFQRLGLTVSVLLLAALLLRAVFQSLEVWGAG